MSQLTERIELPNMRPASDRPLRKKRKANQGLGIGLSTGDDTDGLESRTQNHIQNQNQTQNPEDDWVDHDTASLASVDSDQLYASRPNRWRGTTQQWAHLTEADRGVVSAMHRTRDADLAAHLYNVFQLKQTITSSESKDVNENDNENDAVWKPKPYWTAWPLRARFNPGVSTHSTSSRQKHHSQRASLPVKPAQRHDCARDLFTGPGGPLAEMVTAVILRVAREQFQQRQHALSDTEEGPLDAVVSADDGRSEQILQPTVRHLLAQMDKVLLLLHHTRAATPDFKDAWYILQDQKRHLYRQSKLLGGNLSGPLIMQRLPKPSRAQTQGWPSDEEEDEAEEEAEEEEEENEDDDDDDDEEEIEATETIKAPEPEPAPKSAPNSAPVKVTAIQPPFVPYARPGGLLVFRPPTATPTPVPSRPTHTPIPAPTTMSTPTPTPIVTPTPAPRPTAHKPAASTAYNRASTPRTIPATTQADGSPSKPVGRPHINAERLPGETEAQYHVRRAREGHRRIPDVTYIPPPQVPAISKDRDASAAMWETVLQKHNRLKAKVEAQTAVPLSKDDKRMVEKTEEIKAQKAEEAKTERRAARADRKAKKAEKAERKAELKAEKKAARKAEKKAEKATAKMEANVPDNTVMLRWALRDWSDVIGAAALSGGFDDEVIARTAQRCADLFGQGMALNTMEMPVRKRGDVPYRAAVYKPGQPLPLSTTKPNLGKNSAEDQVQRAWKQRRHRLARRDAIMAEEDEEEEEYEEDEEEEKEEEEDEALKPADVKADPGIPRLTLTPRPRMTSTPSRLSVQSRQSRQRSVGRGTTKKKVSVVFYCPRAGCERAINGFARRTNVVRHLKLVHGLTVSTADIKQGLQ